MSTQEQTGQGKLFELNSSLGVHALWNESLRERLDSPIPIQAAKLTGKVSLPEAIEVVPVEEIDT